MYSAMVPIREMHMRQRTHAAWGSPRGKRMSARASARAHHSSSAAVRCAPNSASARSDTTIAVVSDASSARRAPRRAPQSAGRRRPTAPIAYLRARSRDRVPVMHTSNGAAATRRPHARARAHMSCVWPSLSSSPASSARRAAASSASSSAATGSSTSVVASTTWCLCVTPFGLCIRACAGTFDKFIRACARADSDTHTRMPGHIHI